MIPFFVGCHGLSELLFSSWPWFRHFICLSDLCCAHALLLAQRQMLDPVCLCNAAQRHGWADGKVCLQPLFRPPLHFEAGPCFQWQQGNSPVNSLLPVHSLRVYACVCVSTSPECSPEFLCRNRWRCFINLPVTVVVVWYWRSRSMTGIFSSSSEPVQCSLN